MKKNIIPLLLSMVLGFTLNASAQESEEFKPSGKIFGVLFADYHNTFSEAGNASVFQVSRSYLGYEYSYSKTISSRILVDATAQSTGGKTVMSGYLRNAYLQFDNGKFTLRGGLMETEHISTESKFWNYRYVIKPAIDASGMVFPADIGLMAKFRPADAVVFDLGVINGRGFKDLATDTTYKLVSGITVTPAKNLMFRGYYDLMGPAGRMQMTASITAAYISQTFTLGTELFTQKNHLMSKGDDYSGVSVFSSLRFMEKFSVFGRFDYVSSVTPEGETDPWNLSKDGSVIIIGADYSPARNVRIAPNFTGVMPANESSDFTGTLSLNIEAKF